MALDFIKQTTKNNIERIYIMIPSLYDDSIYTTVLDAIEKAKYPERLTFGLSVQGVSNVDFSNIKNEKRILFLDKNVVYGIGKTRYHIQQLHNDEEYILSVDCHTGFKNGWDVSLIEEHKKLNNPKAIISQFLHDTFCENTFQKTEYGYDPLDPWCVVYKPKPVFKNIDPIIINNKTQRVAPHFIFATKYFAEIKYPYMYFWGDEDSMLSIKLFCNGFDMYELPDTYLTTVPKDGDSCRKRTAWFWTAAEKHTNHFRVEALSEKNHKDAIGLSSNINYEYDNLEYSYHLLYKDKINSVAFPQEFAKLLENGYNDILKEDWRGPDRTLWDYLEFHKITKEQLNNTIESLKKR
jgi:hypothetical protein